MRARGVERPATTPRPRVPRKAGTFGERLTQRRLELGLTQREVAERAGITTSSVAHIERAVYSDGVKAHTLAALASALRVDMDWLWYGEREAS